MMHSQQTVYYYVLSNLQRFRSRSRSRSRPKFKAKINGLLVANSQDSRSIINSQLHSFEKSRSVATGLSFKSRSNSLCSSLIYNGKSHLSSVKSTFARMRNLGVDLDLDLDGSVSHCFARHFSSMYNNSDKKRLRVLGIETSCDDTGAAVLDGYGNILGEALNSQTQIHLKTGGIIPNVAKEKHAQNVEMVVQEALDKANIQIKGLDAIAVTVKPGLIMSLQVGLTHAKCLAKKARQHLIPIHHMEAHALTARMCQRVDFPFLVLLASGGHCLLAVARDIDDFLLLGTTMDDAPGEAFDKTARELKLHRLSEFSKVSGGVAVERMARQGDRDAFSTIHVMTAKADCNFSFTGLKIAARRKVQEEYQRQNISTEDVLPNAADVCAWFQHNVTYHIARRLQRAFIFAEMNDLLKGCKTMVLSGGVASNSHIRSSLEQVCHSYDCQLICPPQRLCTDNGIMIAWNGVEKILAGRPCFHDPDALIAEARSPFGTDISKDVRCSSIKLPKLKLVKP